MSTFVSENLIVCHVDERDETYTITYSLQFGYDRTHFDLINWPYEEKETVLYELLV